MEKTINLLRHEAVVQSEKVVELRKKLEEDSSRLDKRMEDLALMTEGVEIQVEEIAESVAILTNRRTKKLEKDCERRAKRKMEIQDSKTNKKKRLSSSN